MTSQERHEARYQRRKAAREARRKELLDEALDFNKVFTFPHLYHSAQLCFRGVSWKASVQSYKARCGINVARRLRDLRNGVCTLRKCPEFYIRERGHLRRINSIHIDDRVPQKCNSYYSLKPVLHRTLVYDNYASQEGKGTTKARDRVKCMLERHIRKHGMTGGMIVFDIRHFFDSIQHGLVRQVMDRYYDDKWIIGLNMKIIRHNRTDVGLVLGSENSQDFAISTPSSLDHYIREILRPDSSGRYMDDGIIIHHDYEYLKGVLEAITAYAAQLGFTLNEKKSRLLHFGEPFTFLKRKYSFTETGHIIIRPARESVVRERRKLKKLARKYDEGKIPFQTCRESVQAWKASIDGTECFQITQSIDKLFIQLLIPWLVREEAYKPCTTKSYQVDKSSTFATA
ncbi:MAG: RNA-directed DNA polymerase [Oscillospiraceae bacterium]|nr:RNA-directed DNA polymerase [Oscillospiraceae bacterium]